MKSASTKEALKYSRSLRSQIKGLGNRVRKINYSIEEMNKKNEELIDRMLKLETRKGEYDEFLLRRIIQNNMFASPNKLRNLKYNIINHIDLIFKNNKDYYLISYDEDMVKHFSDTVCSCIIVEDGIIKFNYFKNIDEQPNTWLSSVKNNIYRINQLNPDMEQEVKLVGIMNLSYWNDNNTKIIHRSDTSCDEALNKMSRLNAFYDHDININYCDIFSKL